MASRLRGTPDSAVRRVSDRASEYQWGRTRCFSDSVQIHNCVNVRKMKFWENKMKKERARKMQA